MESRAACERLECATSRDVGRTDRRTAAVFERRRRWPTYRNRLLLTQVPDAFRVDTVKIDEACIAGLGRKAASRTIVTVIIQLAHDLGMNVVAEGVETDEQRSQLIELGCDFCQGFYFARPMPAARVSALMLDDAYGSPRRLPAHGELSPVS